MTKDKTSKLNDWFIKWNEQAVLYWTPELEVEAKQQIKALMLELIGEDHEPGNDRLTPYHDTVAQNDLRAELRKKVEEL